MCVYVACEMVQREGEEVGGGSGEEGNGAPVTKTHIIGMCVWNLYHLYNIIEDKEIFAVMEKILKQLQIKLRTNSDLYKYQFETNLISLTIDQIKTMICQFAIWVANIHILYY